MNTSIKVLFIAFSVYLTLACTSTEKTDTASNAQIENRTNQTKTANDTLSDIQILAREFNNSRDIKDLHTSLLKLANNAVIDNNCNKSDIIIKHIQPSLSVDLLNIANLFKAECNLLKISELPETANVAPIMKQTERWLKNLNTQPLLEFNSDDGLTNLIDRKMIALAKFNAKTGQHALAINQLLGLTNNQRFFDKSIFGSTLWDWFTLLEPESRSALSQRFPKLRQYKILIDTIEDESVNDTMRKVVISEWIESESIQEQELPSQILEYLSLNTERSQKIAVLLPLSGRLASQGEAIRNGLLSAYFNKIESSENNIVELLPSIDFIDTGSFDNIRPDVTEETLQSYDTIIGPLLRSHVSGINRMLLNNKKKLLLNQNSILTSDLITDTNLTGSFSLSPEQEASQIVALMREQNVKNPVLINDNSSVSNRMVDAFLDAWQASEINKQEYIAPQLVTYTDNKGMKVGITSALDVLQSEKRIQQVSNITQERVISVTRNRRDIDSFVVFARPDDVELINPIIESSISLFSNEQIPVFASSYGYDHKQNKNTQRDLRNLVFIDMPWLLPNSRNSELAVKVDQLFNNPPSTFLRLFAFGYDSLSLAENLAKLTTFKHIHHDGLSGKLSSDVNNQFIRQLDYIEIENN